MDEVNNHSKKEMQSAALVPKILANAISFLSPTKRGKPLPDESSSEGVQGNSEATNSPAEKETTPMDDKSSSGQNKGSNEAKHSIAPALKYLTSCNNPFFCFH